MSRTQPGEGDKHKEYLGQRAAYVKVQRIPHHSPVHYDRSGGGQ